MSTKQQPSLHDFVHFSIAKAHPVLKQWGTDKPQYCHLFTTQEAMLVDVPTLKDELLAKFPSPCYSVSMAWRPNGFHHEVLS